MGCNGLQHGFVDRKRLDRTNQNNTQRSCAHDAIARCKLHDWGNHAGVVTVLASRCAYCWGNPINSVLAYVEPLKTLLLRILGTLQRTVTVYLGSYDAPSLKPLWLWSDWDAIHKLNTKRPKKRTNGEPFDKLAARGKKWTNGVKDKLKASQAYASEFGMAVAKLTRAEQAGAHRTVAQRLQCEQTEPQLEWGR